MRKWVAGIYELAVRLKDDTETETNGIYKTAFQNEQKTK
jgi:hypothetical protein